MARSIKMEVKMEKGCYICKLYPYLCPVFSLTDFDDLSKKEKIEGCDKIEVKHKTGSKKKEVR
jgi:hypothetical protein